MGESMSGRARAHLKTVILPFWMGLKDDEYGGYYGYVSHDLSVKRDAPKGCVLCSRLLWTFSEAAGVLNDDSLIPYAAHAFDFLRRFWDYEQGGLYWMLDYKGSPLDMMKHTYCQAFGIYGLCAYARVSGSRDARDMAMALYRVIEGRCRDEKGYLEAFGRDFSLVDNSALSDSKGLVNSHRVACRTMNATLHVMEAYTQLYLLTKDKSVLKSLRELVSIMTEKIYNNNERRQEVFFDRDWQSLVDMQSFGHDIEASWLLCETAHAALSENERRRCEEVSEALASSVYERAYHGAWLDNEIEDGETDTTRIWWVQAEAVVGFYNAYQLTGEEKYRVASNAVFENILDKLVDKRRGSEWFWRLDENDAPDDKPIVEPWKCPYHNGRMCMELIQRNA